MGFHKKKNLQIAAYEGWRQNSVAGFMLNKYLRALTLILLTEKVPFHNDFSPSDEQPNNIN